MAEIFDCIIIGAGIEGSATAYQLAKRGRKTLLIEQHELGKSQGSSQGKSRIIRHSYKEDYFTCMTSEAYTEWLDIEKKTGEEIYIKTGLILVDKAPFKELNAVKNSNEKFHLVLESLDSEDLKQRFPNVTYPNYKALFEADAGFLRANVGLQSIQKLFIKSGGHVKDKTEVLSIKPNGPDNVTVKTSNGDFTATSVVICAGPWAPGLLQTLGLNLPLKKQDVNVTYWKELEEGIYNSSKFPAILDLTNDFYSIPTCEYRGNVKALMHAPEMESNGDPKQPLIQLCDYIKEHFPLLDSTGPSIEEKCYYTNTPDEAFILDHHPEHKNIIIGAGFSGTGFKLAPVVGTVLANLVEGKGQHYDLTPFLIKRFN